MDQKQQFSGIGALDTQQEKLFQQFQVRVQTEAPKLIENVQFIPKYQEPAHLVRILIAREWNINQAFDMWKRWVLWRLQYKADEIKEEEISSELKLGKAYWHGYDRLGNPTLVIVARKHFPGQGPQETLIRYFLYLMEIGIKLADEAGTGKVSVIWDREGVTSKNFDTSMLTLIKKIITMLQDNYAERLHMSVILYPNWFAKSMMAIIKPFLSEKSKSKIKLLNKSSELQQYWTPENLIASHSGTSDFKYQWPKGQFVVEENIQVSIEDKEAEEKKLNEFGKQLLLENHMGLEDVD